MEKQTTPAAVYNPRHTYRPGENVPRHGAHRRPNAKKRRRNQDALPDRGTAVAGVGSKGAASRKRAQK